MPKKSHHLVLASASPRRAQLLESAGFIFSVSPPQWEEPALAYSSRLPKAILHLCERKATESMLQRVPKPEEIFLAADTVVTAEKKVFGKPRSPQEAIRTLRLLSGRTHQVLTGWVLLDGKMRKRGSGLAVSKVTFSKIPAHLIQSTVTSGEAMDKAGAYAFQGTGMAWIQSIEGSPSNVMGLPIHDLIPTLIRLGIPRIEPGQS